MDPESRIIQTRHVQYTYPSFKEISYIEHMMHPSLQMVRIMLWEDEAIADVHWRDWMVYQWLTLFSLHVILVHFKPNIYLKHQQGGIELTNLGLLLSCNFPIAVSVSVPSLLMSPMTVASVACIFWSVLHCAQ